MRFGRHQPTAIDGTWLVVPGAQPDATLSWQQVFFERNQAHTVVFMQGRVLPDGRLQLDEVGDHAVHILLKLQRPPHS